MWTLNKWYLPVFLCPRKLLSNKQLDVETNSKYVLTLLKVCLGHSLLTTVKKEKEQAIHTHNVQLFSSFSSYQNIIPNSFWSQDANGNVACLIFPNFPGLFMF